MGGLGGNTDSLIECLISNLNKLDPAFFKDGEGEGGSEANADEKLLRVARAVADLHFASRLPHSITLSFVLASPFFMSLFIIRRYSRAFDLYLSIKKKPF